MKHQQIQLASKRNFIRIMALVAMLTVMVCGMILAVNAADEVETVVINGTDISFENGRWVKTYDGSDAVSATVTVKVGGQELPATAKFDSVNVGKTTITVTYADGQKLIVPAEIRPVVLTWADDYQATASVPYNPNAVGGKYENVEINAPDTAKLQGVGNLDVFVDTNADQKISFVKNGVGETIAYLNVVLAGDDMANCVVEPLKVNVEVTPIEIVSIDWQGLGSFTYGDNAWLAIKAIGNYDGGTVELLIEDLANIVDAGTHSLRAVVPGAIADLYTLAQDVNKTEDITIAPKKYEVVLNNREFLDNGDMVISNIYQLVVEGNDLPAEFLAAINYTYNNSTAAVTKPGTYTVKATLTSDNYRFTVNGVEVAALEATMNVVRNYVLVSTPDGAIVIVGENGISDSVKATLSIPTEFAKKAVRGLKAYKGYTLTVTGAAAGDKFSVRIPVATDLVANKNCQALSIDNLYIYDATAGTKTAAKDTYTVTLSADNSYYIIEGYAPNGAITFLVAPEYNVPFFASALGIALIVFLALVLLVVVPILVGLKLIQIEESGRSAVIAVETEGNVPEVEPAVVPELIEDVDAAIDENLDTLADALAENVEAEEADVDATDAVAEAMDDLNAELAEIKLDEDTTEALNDSADATDAIALVEEEEVVAEEPVAEEPVVEEAVAEETAPETDDSEDEEEESFNGFGSMPLDYIDAVAEAERYAEMLEQESRGEVQLVTRYRRSYLSRLAQSQGSIQDYYNAIKNLLLSYKGVKNRISWNFESFNVGRTPLAKFNAKTRTLYVYIALSPEELADTKYNFTDMSAKKKYAAVPVLLKVKGERKFKHALELFTMLCEEKLQLPKKKTFEEVDYRMPFKTTEELVNEGIIKMMVAAIPVAAPAAEEAPVEEAIVEEAVVEEAVVEETVAEEAPVAEETAEDVAQEVAAEEETATEEAPAEEATEEVVAEEAVEDNDQNA